MEGCGPIDSLHSLVQGQTKGSAGVAKAQLVSCLHLAPEHAHFRAPLLCARQCTKLFIAMFSFNSYNSLVRAECLFPCKDGETEAQSLEDQIDLADSESVPWPWGSAVTYLDRHSL